VERPLDVITAITTAESVVIPAGTLVARDGDEVVEEQVRALSLMGLWIPGEAFYPVTYWVFIFLVPAVWLIVTWRSQVYKSYSPIFYFFYGVLGALMFFYVYRFSSLLLGLPLFLFGFLVLSLKMAEKGLWSMLIPMSVLSFLAVPMAAYNWVSLILVGLLIYGLGNKFFQYETVLTAAGLSVLALIGLEILWCFGSGVRNLSLVWNGLTYTVMGCLAVGLLLVGAFWWEERKGYLNLLMIMHYLNKMGVRSIMVEGGSRVISSFLRCRLVDRAVITLAPVWLAGLPVLEREMNRNQIVFPSGYPRLAKPFYQHVGTNVVACGLIEDSGI